MAFKKPSEDLSKSSNVPSIGRNKVALKPGRSLMDWIRLTHSGKDLSSTKGKIRVITPSELTKHNKKDDAWICLKGKVYNITHYFEYHPGGEEELMRGAGRDATDLFNQVHRWVNAESMLQKCYIGPLKSSSFWFNSDIVTSETTFKKENHLNSHDITLTPRYEWCQTLSDVQISIYSLQKNIEVQDFIIDLLEKNLLISQNIENSTYVFHMALEDSVSDDYEVQIHKKSKLKIILQKKSPKEWEKLGLPLERHNSIVSESRKYIHYRSCKLIKKVPVNHNTFIFSFELPAGTIMAIPLGRHINIKANINGTEVIRSYTPVLPTLEEKDSQSSQNAILHFMIKIYDNGILTPVLKEYKIGDSVFISDYIGQFSFSMISNCSLLIMLSAGTGLTPMIRILKFAMSRENGEPRKVLLVFFNKSRKDILWYDELQALAEKEERFTVFHVLSEPDPDWNGATGYLNKQLLGSFVPDDMKDSETYFCVCGPYGFTESALRYLNELEYHEENIHAFVG